MWLSERTWAIWRIWNEMILVLVLIYTTNLLFFFQLFYLVQNMAYNMFLDKFCKGLSEIFCIIDFEDAISCDFVLNIYHHIVNINTLDVYLSLQLKHKTPLKDIFDYNFFYFM